MENEYQVLSSIEKNKDITQRDIARNTGMSLGSVNVLIKRLVKKGLLKIERLNTRTIRYILTPQGFKEKAERAYRYVASSYRHINGINNRIDSVAQSPPFKDGGTIYLFGKDDEIYELLTDRLKHRKIDYIHARTIEELEELLEKTGLDCSGGLVFLAWHPGYIEILGEKNIRCVNLLDEI